MFCYVALSLQINQTKLPMNKIDIHQMINKANHQPIKVKSIIDCLAVISNSREDLSDEKLPGKDFPRVE